MNLKQQFLEIEKNLAPCVGALGELHPNSVDDLAHVIKAAENPKEILDIGFRRGVSTAMWLLTSQAKVTSIDLYSPEKHPSGDFTKSVTYLTKTFANRFQFIRMDSLNIPKKEDWQNKFDLVFIDGDHSKDLVLADTKNAIQHLKVKYILFDDYYTGAAIYIKEAITKYSLKIVNTYLPHPNSKWVRGVSGGGHCLVKVL